MDVGVAVCTMTLNDGLLVFALHCEGMGTLGTRYAV